MNLPTPGMLTRKPGLAPLLLPLSMIHEPSGIDASSTCPSAHGPCTTSSGDIGARPMRLTNQLESGTSSNALTSTAGPAGSTAKKREIGRNTSWLAPSQANADSYGSGAGANGR